MKFFNPGGNPEYVRVGQAFSTADGTSYPANWLELAGPPDGVSAVTDPQPTDAPSVVPDPNAVIYDQIREIERSVTPRRLREAVLTDVGKAWLDGVESQIDVLRTQLV